MQLCLILTLFFIGHTFAAPADPQHSLVVSSTEPSHGKETGKEVKSFL